MFAILINEENLPKIQAHQAELDHEVAHFYKDVYLTAKVNWYYIRGVMSDHDGRSAWSVYPEEMLMRTFQCDVNKAQTDWDIIVQK